MGDPEHITQACEGSLRRLQLDVIPLFQMHTPDPDVPYEESVGACAELQAAGKVRHIGLSNVDVDQLRRAQAVTTVTTVQNRYNLTDRSSQDVLDVCTAEGIGFIPWAPLAPGEDDAARRPGPRRPTASAPPPARSPWPGSWSRSPVMLPIPGTGSVAHVEENVAAAGLELTDDERAALDATA